ncbi:major facilitator superfamily domain-containing protein 2B isoform X4 [Bos indicus x Bos taurus]|uniref:major facilitator superfamily domain-containing protein 2B isoform X4 n=1 Tax=Bos indicus x Bos taurus TaxID=30522 RepID=UPI000D535BB0|nr:major facilitator superfamily domain-containing protein 2B isoform X4 [Bos indicus x Bos taurus]
MAVYREAIPGPALETPSTSLEAHTSAQGSDSGAGRLSFYRKLCYGIGGVPNQVASSAIAFYLQLFLLDVAQIPAAQVSLVLFGGKVSGAAADPLAGFLINRSRRTGSGRLMPWVLGCMPFIALAYFFLWFLPPFTTLRGLWYTTLYCLFQALATFFQVPYTALTMLLTPNPKERDSATAYRMTLEMAGTLMGATVHGLIVSGAHGSHRCKEDTLPGEGAVSPNAVEQSYLVLFCTHASQLQDHVQGMVLTILVSAVLSTPMWEWVLQRFGKRMSALGICAMVPFAILLAAVPMVPVAYVVAFVSGLSIAVSLLLPWSPQFGSSRRDKRHNSAAPAPRSMLPDVVDDFQLQHQHGPGLETIFYSSYVFFTKLSGAGALGISTLSLDFAGYESGACRQSEQVVVTLKVLIGAVPTSMILIGLCILMVGPTPKVPSRANSRSLGRRTSYTLA